MRRLRVSCRICNAALSINFYGEKEEMIMKKLLRLSLVITLVAALILAVQIFPTQAKPIVLKYATMNPPASWHHLEFYVPWAEGVKKVTEGRVEVKIYPSQTLGKAPSFFDHPEGISKDGGLIRREIDDAVG